MSFEDRVRAAAAAQQQEQQAAAQAARDAGDKTAAARQAARAMLPEVRSALVAVQKAGTPPPRPAKLGEEGHKFAWDENIVRDDFRWRVSLRLHVEKEGRIRPRWVCVFDAWYFSLGISTPRTTILVRRESAEITYDTGQPWTERPPLTVEEFAELGLVSWEAGSWKDSSWPAGSLRASDSFDLFLDAAAALVTRLSTQ